MSYQIAALLFLGVLTCGRTAVYAQGTTAAENTGTPLDSNQMQRLCDALTCLYSVAIPELEAEVARILALSAPLPGDRARLARVRSALRLSRSAYDDFSRLKTVPGGLRVGPDGMKELARTNVQYRERCGPSGPEKQYGDSLALDSEWVVFASSQFACPGVEGDAMLAALLVHEQFRRESDYCRPAGMISELSPRQKKELYINQEAVWQVHGTVLTALARGLGFSAEAQAKFFGRRDDALGQYEEWRKARKLLCP